jgi:hypothetical protein
MVRATTAAASAGNRRANRSLIVLMFALVAAFGSIGAATTKPAALDLLARAADPNPGLSSYIAAANLSATLHALVPVHKSFNGTVYYLKPKRKIVFENVSGPLSRFKELTSSSPSFDELSASYDITPLADDGTTSTYSLVPKKPGARVAKIEVSVDDDTALPKRIVWDYTNGGTLRADQQYVSDGGFHVIDVENISARFPDYSADGVLHFSNYRLNAPVDASIFTAN